MFHSTRSERRPVAAHRVAARALSNSSRADEPQVRPAVYGSMAFVPAALMAIPDVESVRYFAIFTVWAVTIVLWWRALQSKRR